jgi:hypothetical protein
VATALCCLAVIKVSVSTAGTESGTVKPCLGRSTIAGQFPVFASFRFRAPGHIPNPQIRKGDDPGRPINRHAAGFVSMVVSHVALTRIAQADLPLMFCVSVWNRPAVARSGADS